MKLMTWLKFKFAMGMALLLAGGAGVVAIKQTGVREELTAREIAQATQDAYDALSSYSDSGTVVAETDGVNKTTEFSIRLLRPNSYRVDWVETTGGRYTGRGNVWSCGSESFVILATPGRKATYEPQEAHDMQTALAMSADASHSASSTIPRLFYARDYSETLGLPGSGHDTLEKERDEIISGVDCYVVKSIAGPAKCPSQGPRPNAARKPGTTTMFWIGKLDHFIHQAQTITPGEFITETHENIAANPSGMAAFFTH